MIGRQLLLQISEDGVACPLAYLYVTRAAWDQPESVVLTVHLWYPKSYEHATPDA